MKKTSGVLIILLASLMFGSYGVWAKFIGNDFDVFFQSWSRGLIIALVLLPFLYYKKLIVPIKKEDIKWLAVFLIFTVLTQAPMFYAFNHMDMGSATLLFFVSMLITMYIVGFVSLGEKLTKIKIISFVSAVIGMYLIFNFSIVNFTTLAASMAVLNGFASGGEVSFSKKISSSYSALYLTWLSWIFIVLTNLPISLWLGETQHMPSFDLVWLWQLIYSVVSMLSFWLIIEGLKYVESSVGGLLGLLEIIFSILYGIVLLSEKLTLQIILGALFILLAASLPHIENFIHKNKIN